MVSVDINGRRNLATLRSQSFKGLSANLLSRAAQTFPSRIRGDFILKQKPVLAQNVIPPVLSGVFRFNKVWPRSEFAKSDPRDSNVRN